VVESLKSSSKEEAKKNKNKKTTVDALYSWKRNSDFCIV